MHMAEESKTSNLIRVLGLSYKAKAALINESGLYGLILSSKLPQVREFKRFCLCNLQGDTRRTNLFHFYSTRVVSTAVLPAGIVTV